MFYILLSICCSVIVSILLKLARRYIIHVPQAVAWNYLIATGLTWYFYNPAFQPKLLYHAPIYIYIILGVLLPSLFLVIAASVRYTGIVRTDVAQRLSLFIPLTASFLLFNESISLIKTIGIIIGFTAILFLIPWQKSNHKKSISNHTWIYPLIVFAGMGLIDILFKKIAALHTIPYTTSLLIVFILSFCVSICGLIYLFIFKKRRFSWRHIGFGAILGVFNFGNILFYLKAHHAIAKNPSVVFSTMNIGVIVLGTFVGMFIFREKLSILNKAGILLAIAAILIISITS